MNIDERIEALTMSLELLTHDHEDFKHHMAELLVTMREEQALVGQAVVKLTQIIVDHETRITGLEKQ